MKAVLALLVALLAIFVSGSEAMPEKQFKVKGDSIYSFEPLTTLDHAGRQRRFTCDVMSATINGNSFNHAPCAMVCLAMMRGYKGGYCDDRGVCNCRL